MDLHGDEFPVQKPTTQEYLDRVPYSAQCIGFLEQVFGHTFVSAGGLDSAKEFIPHLELKAGHRVLDVGGGIGGNAFYMAQNYGTHVLSLDISSNMTQIGRQRAQEAGCGSDQVEFKMADVLEADFPQSYFDAIHSRDVFMHIADKNKLFDKLFKWLRPEGKLLITDYCCQPGKLSQSLKDYAHLRRYSLLTIDGYRDALTKAGFTNVQVRDVSDMLGAVCQSDIALMDARKDQLIEAYGEKLYQIIFQCWIEKANRIKNGEQIWALVLAEKSK